MVLISAALYLGRAADALATATRIMVTAGDHSLSAKDWTVTGQYLEITIAHVSQLQAAWCRGVAHWVTHTPVALSKQYIGRVPESEIITTITELAAIPQRQHGEPTPVGMIVPMLQTLETAPCAIRQ
jgi:hypothetical protein